MLTHSHGEPRRSFLVFVLKKKSFLSFHEHLPRDASDASERAVSPPPRRRTREKPALTELAERGFCSKGDTVRRSERRLFQAAFLSKDEDFDISLLRKGWDLNSFASIHCNALLAVQCVDHSE